MRHKVQRGAIFFLPILVKIYVGPTPELEQTFKFHLQLYALNNAAETDCMPVYY